MYTLYPEIEPFRTGRLRVSDLHEIFYEEVGREGGTPVTQDYNRRTSVFNGKIHWVQIDLGKDDHDHLISPEERLRLAMIRQ